jgi:hypothetical protein
MSDKNILIVFFLISTDDIGSNSIGSHVPGSRALLV